MLNRLCYDTQSDGLRSPMKVPKLTASCLSVIAFLVSPAISAVPQLQPSKQPKFCIDYNSSNQDVSTSTMAVSDRYIVFGNDKTNQVTIYQRDDQDRWLRFRTITPPADSPFAKIGSGFGSSVAFDQNTLVIGAYSESRSSVKRELFDQMTDNGKYFSSAIYKTLISSANSLVRIDNSTPKEVVGGKVAIHKGRIAFSVVRRYDTKIISYIKVLSGQNVQTIEEPLPVTARFGWTFALRDNLLITANIARNGASLWMYNLDRIGKSPRKIALNFIPDQIYTSDEFIAAGIFSIYEGVETLIINRSNQSRMIIRRSGNIAINDKVMIRSHTGTDFGESHIPAQMEIFDLRRKSPKLIEKREGVYDLALLSKNYLFIVQRELHGLKICIERPLT
jgi:hypothetical protein